MSYEAENTEKVSEADVDSDADFSPVESQEEYDNTIEEKNNNYHIISPDYFDSEINPSGCMLTGYGPEKPIFRRPKCFGRLYYNHAVRSMLV